MKKPGSHFEVVPLREVLSKSARDAGKINRMAPPGRLDEELVAERGFDELSERVFHPRRHNDQHDGKQ